MLEILYGPAGSGKTEYIFDRLKTAADQPGRPILLLVPEQFSFENERALLRRLKPQQTARIRVVTFSRLAELVLRAGGVQRTPVDEMSALLLTAEAVRQLDGQLPTLGRYVRRPEATGDVLAAVRECRRAVNADNLSALLAHTNQPLIEKIGELLLIADTYTSLLRQSACIDEEDKLTLCADRLAASGLVNGALVFADSFKGFTAREAAVLHALLRTAESVTVSLCTDTLHGVPGERFYAPASTAALLRRLAEKAGVPCRETALPRRTGCSLLPPALERTVLTGQEEPQPQPSDAVLLQQCRDRRDCAGQAARLIRRRLRETGLRARDFVVVVRRMEDWKGLLDAALEKEGVPYYMDTRRPVLTDPLFATLLAALACADAPDTEEMLRLARLGLVCRDEEALALERYAFIWSIRGQQWNKPFTLHPDGLQAQQTEQSRQTLESLEQTRRRLTEPLRALHSVLHAQHALPGSDFAAAVTAYLDKAGIPQALADMTGRLRGAGEHTLAERTVQGWQLLTEILSRLADTFGAQPIPAARWKDHLKMLISRASLGSVPPSLDAVQIGQADRIRYQSPDTVLLLGLNDGEFPAAPAAGGLLTDAERAWLTDRCDFQFDADPLAQVSEEAFYAYAAVSAPRALLYAACFGRESDGKTVPSSLWLSLQAVLPQQPVLTGSAGPESAADLFEELAAGAIADPSRRAAAVALLRANDAYRAPLRALADAAGTRRFSAPLTGIDQKNKTLYLSASRAEDYFRCPFLYYCRHVLRLAPPKPARVDSPLAGTLVHEVLATVLAAYVKPPASLNSVQPGQIRADVAGLLDARIAALDQASGRYDQTVFFLRTVQETCVTMLCRLVEELKESRFCPVGFEVPIGGKDEDGRDNPVPAWTAPGLSVQGKVDRVDLYRDNDEQRYLRIIDYKSTQRGLSLKEILRGRNLQMLIYLFALCDNGPYAGARPAGLLYVPYTPRDADIKNDDDPKKALCKALQGQGLLYNDADLVRNMEEHPGTFIRAGINKDGTLSKHGLIVDDEQMDLLRRYVTHLLQQMKTQLQNGVIPAEPFDEKKACASCDFACICGRTAARQEDDEPAPGDEPETDGKASYWDEMRRALGEEGDE
ncbi:MAG: PD-(D/E)XK nuclease family protein [Clostridia bacterium]|nr:PD-(D/E)XK nuclease family protein [Clostridia bacterium]